MSTDNPAYRDHYSVERRPDAPADHDPDCDCIECVAYYLPDAFASVHAMTGTGNLCERCGRYWTDETHRWPGQ